MNFNTLPREDKIRKGFWETAKKSRIFEAHWEESNQIKSLDCGDVRRCCANFPVILVNNKIWNFEKIHLTFVGMIWWYVPELLDRYIDFISLVHQLSRRGNLMETARKRFFSQTWMKTAQKAEIFVDSKKPWKIVKSWVEFVHVVSFLFLLKPPEKSRNADSAFTCISQKPLCAVDLKRFHVHHIVYYIYIQSLLRHLLSHSMVHLEYRFELLVHHIPCASYHISLSLVTWWTNIAGTLTTWPLPSTSINLSIWWTDCIEVDTRFLNENCKFGETPKVMWTVGPTLLGGIQWRWGMVSWSAPWVLVFVLLVYLIHEFM